MYNEILKLIQKYDKYIIEVYIEKTKTKRFRKRDLVIEDISSNTSLGGQLRIYYKSSVLYAYFNDINKIEQLLDSLVRHIEIYKNKKHDFHYEITDFNSIVLFNHTSNNNENFEVAIDYINNKMEILKNSCNLHLCVLNYGSIIKEKIYINSLGSIIIQNFDDHSFNGAIFINKNKNIRHYSIASGGIALNEALERFEEQCNILKESYLTTLPIISINKDFYDIILDHESAGVFIHETIGHMSEIDTKAMDCDKFIKGGLISNDLLNVNDDPSLDNYKGSYLFDDQGNLGRKTKIIEQGTFSNYLVDRRANKLLGLPLTGNSRLVNFSHPPIVRMSNIFVKPGTGDVDNMISSIKFGLYIRGVKSATTEGFKFRIVPNAAFVIKMGKIVGQTNNIIITGNKESLLSISDLSSNTKTNTGMFCSKENQRHLPVSVTAPAIRFKCRVEEF